MFDREQFCENKKEKGSYFAIGFAEGVFKSTILVAMRAVHYGYDLDELAAHLEWTEDEVKIGKELYDGIMGIAKGKELAYRYFINNMLPQCGSTPVDFHAVSEELVKEIVNKFWKEIESDAT